MPLWVGLLCVILAVSSLGFSVLTWAQNYQVVLPFIQEFAFVQPHLKVSSTVFHYNVLTMRYDNVTIDVQNTDTVNSHVGTIFVKLFTNGNVQIASAQTSTGSIGSSNTVVVTVDLRSGWIGNYTVADCVSAYVQIQETS